MNSIKNIKNKSERIQIAVAVTFILALIIPMLYLTYYAGPSADDFANTRSIFNSSGNSNIEKALAFCENTYFNQQGTYFGTFLCVFTPIVFKLNAFAIMIFLNMCLFFGAVLYFIRVLYKEMFNCHKWSVALWTYLGAIFLMTQFSNPNETFYWYTGIVMYTFPATLSFFAFSFLIKAFKMSESNTKKTILYTVATGVLAFCAIGGILIIPVVFGIVMLAFVIWAWIKKHPYRKILTVLFILCTVCIALNVLAPGYSSRAEKYTWRTDFAITSVMSYNLEVLNIVLTQLAPIAIIATCVALIIPVSSAVNDSTLKFSHPVLALLTGGLIVFFCIFPNSYGEGGAITSRYASAATWVIGITSILTTVYITGNLVKKYDFSIDTIYKKFTLVTMVAIAFCVVFTTKPFRNNVSTEIVVSFAYNWPQIAKDERERVLNDVANYHGGDVLIDRPSFEHPYLMGLRLTDDISNWHNTSVAAHYGKDSLSLVPVE